MRISRRLHAETIIRVCFLISLASGGLMILFGNLAPYIFMLCMLMGSLGMTLISFPWGNTIIALGTMTLLTALTSTLAWPLVIKRAIRLPHPMHLAEESEASNS
jgi:hypothetical protein